jgi:spore coat protein U-like protein
VRSKWFSPTTLSRHLLTVIFISALAALPAFAADINNIAVSTTVIPICKFSSPTSTMTFVMDASSSANATASTTLSYWCTKGSSATVTFNTGLYPAGASPRMRHSTIVTSFVPYTLNLAGAAQAGQGKNVPLNLMVNGTVLNASFINSDVGTYGDTVSITVSP